MPGDGRRLWFYFGAWSGLSRRPEAEWVMAGGSVGMAKLRRDGFASLDAGEKSGTLTTVPLCFTGRFPFVNVAAAQGALRTEILDADGKTIAPFSLENSVPVTADSTRKRLAWIGADDLAALSSQPVLFRFHLTHGSLYAFWVSAATDGASNGYVAAGGPGFTGPTDTPGR